MTEKELQDFVKVLIKDTAKCLEYLQQTDHTLDSIENGQKAEKATKTISLFISKALERGNDFQAQSQSLFNLAFRLYYRLIRKFELTNDFENFLENHQQQLIEGDKNCFLALNALLLLDDGQNFDSDLLKEICIQALQKCISSNNHSHLEILRTINVFVRKYPSVEIEITLSDAYSCLQSSRDAREDILEAFTRSCKSRDRGLAYFEELVKFYPWTNRNKYYLLSCILREHRLSDLFQENKDHLDEFFGGLRSSLNSKHLLSASQCLIKALSNQESKDLLDLSVDILAYGSLNEIGNFRSQWFSRIKQKEILFQRLQENSKIESMFQQSALEPKSSLMEIHRFVLIFCMYSNDIFKTSKLHFFKISTELITNCFHFDHEIQLWIYKCIVENMTSFALEDCLDFFLNFIKYHKGIENAEFRNNILSKIAIIVNYIAKCFVKARKSTGNGRTTLDSSIKSFFSQLHEIIDADIPNELYQPKIFALKLFKILYQSLYQKKLERNVKNCSLDQNVKLGEFLILQEVFNAEKTSDILVRALNDPSGYDDALDLIVDLMQRMQTVDTKEMLKQCLNLSESKSVDECMISERVAKVACLNDKTLAFTLFDYSVSKLRDTSAFAEDPLLTCKTVGHLFGFLNNINEILPFCAHTHDINYDELIGLLERIQNIILGFLNLNNVGKKDLISAASFQDMDESLQILVEKSAHDVKNQEECRTFLLMSFWLTLKACCDVATTLGCLLDITSGETSQGLAQLSKCLNINVRILTNCRHKGAIESTGLSIGKLTRYLTSLPNLPFEVNNLLYHCLSLLFDDGKCVSTTRRGAGFSIMFLHMVKNDEQPGRPLLKYAMKEILQRLKSLKEVESSMDSSNRDRIEALTLHYLCVLVKDADLREAIVEYRSEIMLVAIANIEHPEWTICNAALQLFGALVPKILGQKRAAEFEDLPDWEPTEVTYKEILCNLPYALDYIMNYCSGKIQCKQSVSTRSVILFLGFLSKIDHLHQDVTEQFQDVIHRLRELMWSLLSHRCEKVRKLASICYVRAHEFRFELPRALLRVSGLIFQVGDENFFEGLVFVLSDGVLKLRNEAVQTLDSKEFDDFFENLKLSLEENFLFQNKFKFYTQAKMLEMLLHLGFEAQAKIINNLIEALKKNALEHENDIGYDKWHQKLLEIGRG